MITIDCSWEFHFVIKDMISFRSATSRSKESGLDGQEQSRNRLETNLQRTGDCWTTGVSVHTDLYRTMDREGADQYNYKKQTPIQISHLQAWLKLAAAYMDRTNTSWRKDWWFDKETLN